MPTAASDSCSRLTGAEPDVVFCCSPTSRLDVISCRVVILVTVPFLTAQTRLAIFLWPLIDKAFPPTEQLLAHWFVSCTILCNFRVLCEIPSRVWVSIHPSVRPPAHLPHATARVTGDHAFCFFKCEKYLKLLTGISMIFIYCAAAPWLTDLDNWYKWLLMYLIRYVFELCEIFLQENCVYPVHVYRLQNNYLL